jgi:hypothetical protein
MTQTIHVPWYATGLRGDRLAAVLQDVTPTALRYGATSWSLHRSKDDRYKFLQIVQFEDKLDFERWWEGHEMVEMRTMTSGWWQVPQLYFPHELLGEGRIEAAVEAVAETPAPEPAPAATA